MKIKIRFLILFVLFTVQYFVAQENRTNEVLVKGTVKDFDGQPIKGAFIYIDSLRTRVKTNSKGNFKIRLKPETHIVSVYSRNNGLFSLVFTGEHILNFDFPRGNTIIDEDEMEILGFYEGNVKEVKKKTKDYSQYRDVYQMLIAEVPGVQVNGSNIFLRGTSRMSINSGLAPLLIVDGTQVSSIDFIQPNEVKSLKVIRDENASLYGVRGANGVIIIELTK